MPLMGIRGGINYNPVLSRRQLRFSLRGPPEKRDVRDSLFYNVSDGVELKNKATRA